MNTHADLVRVLDAGVAGVNSDNLDLLAEVVANAESSMNLANSDRT